MPLNLLLAALAAASGPGSVTPVDAASTTFIGYVTSLGVAGIGLLALFWLYVFPGRLTKQAREDARADLLRENDRLREQLAHTEEQRDEALKVAQDKLVPLLVNFVSVTSALVPLLQQVVTSQERNH